MSVFLEKCIEKAGEKASTVTVVNRGLTPLSLLGVAFVIFKILGYITWSWWWVLAPFWIPVVLALAVLTVLLIVLVALAYKAEDKVKMTVEVKEESSKSKSTKTKSTRTKKSEKDDGAGVKGKNE